MIYVIATVELAEGKRAAYLREFNRVVSLVRSEEGCLEYGLAVDVPSGLPIQKQVDKDAIPIMERWTDIDALKAHLAAPHTQAYLEATKDCVKQVDIRVLAPL